MTLVHKTECSAISSMNIIFKQVKRDEEDWSLVVCEGEGEGQSDKVDLKEESRGEVEEKEVESSDTEPEDGEEDSEEELVETNLMQNDVLYQEETSASKLESSAKEKENYVKEDDHQGAKKQVEKTWTVRLDKEIKDLENSAIASSKYISKVLFQFSSHIIFLLYFFDFPTLFSMPLNPFPFRAWTSWAWARVFMMV